MPEVTGILMFDKYLICSIMSCWVYRYRGMAKLDLNLTESRILCAITLSVLFLWLNISLIIDGSIPWYLPATCVPGMFVALTLPHGFCHDMGRNPYYQKGPTSYLLPTIDPVAWSLWSERRRTWYDMLQMALVGLHMGFLIYAPTLFFGGLIAAFGASIVLGVFMSLAYFSGYRINGSVIFKTKKDEITLYMDPYSSDWGEFLSGMAFIFSFGTFLVLYLFTEAGVF